MLTWQEFLDLQGNNTIKRMWINQPSKLQPYHDLHGTKVLADFKGDSDIVVVYFIDGAVISQKIHSTALSDGW